MAAHPRRQAVGRGQPLTRTAFVAGGSRGIGAAVCRALAENGADVAVGYLRREAHAKRTAEAVEAQGRRAVLVRGDVAAGMEALVEEATAGLGGLDALVLCAVLPLPRPIDELGPHELRQTMTTNFEPFVTGSVAAAQRMDGGGRIVGLSATGAHVIRNPRYAPLGLAKGAIEAAVRFLAVSLAPRGITVNAVAPGPTETEAFDAMSPDPEGMKARLASVTPMGRMGTPDDAARLIAFLCSDEAGWITGQLIYSDGGYTLV